MLSDFRLSSLPRSARITLTAFLTLIGFGYLSALGNLYYQQELADGKPGLTLDDLRVTFHGADIEIPPSSATSNESAPIPQLTGQRAENAANPNSELHNPQAARVTKSRMLEMVEPGGKMRKNLVEGGESAVRVLTTWLEQGAPQATFEKMDFEKPDDPSPSLIIADHCLSCHNAASGEKKETPYGPDLFTVDYQMVFKYAAPGTAHSHSNSDRTATSPSTIAPASSDRSALANSTQSRATQASKSRRLGPVPISHLFLTTHLHMLTIPVFTLILAGLFLFSNAPGWLKSLITAAPMITLIFDFGCWWLARIFEPAIYVLAVTGGIFGLTIAIQLLTVTASLWIRPRTAASPKS